MVNSQSYLILLLLQAAAPSSVAAGSSAGEKTFMRLVEASEWLQLLQAVMQIAGAVTDLMDIQVILASD